MRWLKTDVTILYFIDGYTVQTSSKMEYFCVVKALCGRYGADFSNVALLVLAPLQGFRVVSNYVQLALDHVAIPTILSRGMTLPPPSTHTYTYTHTHTWYG